MSEEAAILWQDILDLVMGGRVSNLACPFCQKGQIQVTKLARTTRLECPSCRQFIEGAFQDSMETDSPDPLVITKEGQ